MSIKVRIMFTLFFPFTLFLIIFFWTLSVTIFFFKSFSLFNIIWSSYTCLGVNGTRVMVLFSFTKECLFLNPSWLTFLSNCQGLPNKMWPTCIGTTSQSTLSLYLLIEKVSSTCLFTLTSPQSFNHYNLYGLGCFKVGKFKFSTKVVLATLVQLPPSIIILHTLLLMWHLVWKMFSLCCSMSSSLT